MLFGEPNKKERGKKLFCHPRCHTVLDLSPTTWLVGVIKFTASLLAAWGSPIWEKVVKFDWFLRGLKKEQKILPKLKKPWMYNVKCITR